MSEPPGPSTPLIGRATAMRRVRGLLAAGSDGALLVVGDPGIGKTALLHDAAVVAEAAGRRVLSTALGEFQTLPGLAGLTPLLTPLLDHTTTLSPAQRTAIDFVRGVETAPAPSPLTVGAAVHALWRASAARTRLALLLDDSQWLDPASSALLGFVGRRLTATGVTLLVATRPGSSNGLEKAGIPQVELAPLAEQHARALLDRHHPRLSPRVRADVLASAAGNPLALIELPRTRPSAHTAVGGEPEASGGLPPRVTRLFASRIAALPQGARTALLLAALEGTGDLATISGAAGEETLDQLSSAERDGLISVDESTGTLRFVHPLVPSTAVELAGDAARHDAHRRLAQALVADPLRHSWHLAAATRDADEEVAALLEHQGHAALRRGDTTTAAALLRRSAELSPEAGESARRQAHAAFIGADVTGDLTAADALLSAVDELEPAVMRSLPAALAASAVMLNADYAVDRAHRLLREAIAEHPGRDNPQDPVLEDALHHLLLLTWFGGRASLAQELERALARLGGQVPPLVGLCHQLFMDPVHADPSSIDELDTWLHRIGAEQDLLTITRLALAAIYTDRLPECRQALSVVVEDGRRGGAVALAINALVSGCVDGWLTGQWDQADQMATESAALCQEHGIARYLVPGGYIQQLVRTARGEVGEPQRFANRLARDGADRGAGLAITWAEHLWALHASATGDYESAYRHLTRIGPVGALAPYNPQALWVLFDVVEAAVATGRCDSARAHVAAMRRCGIDRLSPRVRMVVTGCAALAAGDSTSAALYTEALDVPEGPQWPFDRARIELAFGEHLRSRRDLDRARLHLGSALDTFHRLGARPWEDRGAAQLRAAGVELSPSPRGQGTGVATLSPRERQVAELAGRGLTNREIGDQLFLSPRSVGAILYRLFPRLGITSRAALGAALEQEATPTPSPSGSSRVLEADRDGP